MVSFDVGNEGPLWPDRCHVPVTFSLPAASAMLAPQMIPLVTESGKNEVALSGYIHEPVELLENDPEQARQLSQPVECSAKQTGKRPVGSSTAAGARIIYTIAIACSATVALPIPPVHSHGDLPHQPPVSPPGAGRDPLLVSTSFSIFPLEVD